MKMITHMVKKNEFKSVLNLNNNTIAKLKKTLKNLLSEDTKNKEQSRKNKIFNRKIIHDFIARLVLKKQQLRTIVDFISSMSDDSAINFYERIETEQTQSILKPFKN